MIILIVFFLLLSLIVFLRYNNREKNYQPIMSNKLITDRIINHKTDRKIPKNIVQSLNSRKLTKNLYDNIDNIKKLNPDYNYEFFTEKESIEFINKYYGLDYAKVYIKLYPGAFRADFFRYCYLYQKGGIWIDISMTLEKSLDSIIDKDYNFILCRDIWDKNNIKNHPYLVKFYYKYFTENNFKNKSRIYNAFLAFEPKNNLMKKVLEESYQNIINNREPGGLAITGPDLFGKVYDNFNLENYTYKITNFKLVNFFLKIIRNEDGKLDNGIFDEKNNKIITNKYPGHRKDMDKINSGKGMYKNYNDNLIFIENILYFNDNFNKNYKPDKENIIYENIDNLSFDPEKNNIIFDNFTNNNKLVKEYLKLIDKGFLIYCNTFKIKENKDFFYSEITNNNYKLII